MGERNQILNARCLTKTTMLDGKKTDRRQWSVVMKAMADRKSRCLMADKRNEYPISDKEFPVSKFVRVVLNMCRFITVHLAGLPFPSEPYPGPYRGGEGGLGGLGKVGCLWSERILQGL